MIHSEERNDITPICPHCKHLLNTIWFRQIASTLGKRYVYICPSCRASLGISHRKGFWMG